MKKLLTLALGVAMLTAFTGLSVAQDKKPVEKSKPTGIEMKQPAPGERMMGGRVCSNCYVCKCNTGSAGCLCDSTVTNMDNKTKTISVKRKDGAIIVLDASKLTTSPKIGQTVHVQYVDVGGKPTAQSITIRLGPLNK